MTATVRLDKVAGFEASWQLVVNGQLMPLSTVWEVTSRYGSVETAVVLDKSAVPVFDRPAYLEAPNVNVIAFGRDRKGVVHVAVIRQPRPHADDPERPGVDGHTPVTFGQIPMGFAEKILGGKFETPEDAARRETEEETGATAVIKVTRPSYPWHNPNPTFVRTWSDLLFAEVDLERVETLKSTRNEPIYTAEYIPVPELLRRIRDGKDELGAVYRMCTANSLWMIFFSTFPELWEIPKK